MTSTVLLTGATGFIGRRIARILLDRGDAVIAPVRDPSRAPELAALGARLVASDLASTDELIGLARAADRLVHAAGWYSIGIPASARAAMYEANVATTERVLDAAIAGRVERIVHVSTLNVAGDTGGRVVDETHVRDPAAGFTSTYDETKTQAHQAALTRIGRGGPIVIVQPSTVYGPGDHSGFGEQLQAAFDGTARFIALGDVGVSPVFVDDVAAGIVAALDRGGLGEAYFLTGDNLRLAAAMRIVAAAAGRRPPRLVIPAILPRLAARLGPGRGALLGLAPNLAEIVRTTDGVTYWGSHAKATRELGYAPRSLAVGAVDAFGPQAIDAASGAPRRTL